MARVVDFDRISSRRRLTARRKSARHHRQEDAPLLDKDGRMLAVPVKPLIQARARRDPEFRKALIQGAIDCMLEGDVETGNYILRNYVNAAIGFEKLARATKIPSKSLMRMLGPKGNPQSKNLFAVLAQLQKMSKFRLEVSVKD